MFTKRSIFHVFSILIMLISMLVLDGGFSASAKKSSQESKPDVKSLQKPDRCLGTGADTAYQALTGKIRFVGTKPGKSIPQPVEGLRSALPEAAARGYLSKCGSLFGISN